MTKKYSRRFLREKVLQILYAFEMNGEGLQNITEGILTEVENDEDKDFCRKLTNKIVANRKELDAIIGEKISNWEVERIAVIDRLLLRMGMTEILYFPDIPPKVSINEVIEISKNYSTSNSGKFLNGILDNMLIELKTEGRLSKAGRGLLEETLKKHPKNSKSNEK